MLLKEWRKLIISGKKYEENWKKKSIAQDRYHSITFDQQDQYNLITLELFLILKT